MIRLLIFDLDGTLFHTVSGIQIALNRVLKEYDREAFPIDFIKRIMGGGLRTLVQKLDAASEKRLQDLAEIETRFHEVYKEIYIQESQLMPGVYEFLKNWPEKLAIVSNKNEAYVKGLIESSSLKEFEWVQVIGGDTLPSKKPDPLPLIQSIQSAGVEKHEAVMIGDGVPDVLAAKAAGIQSLVVDFGYTPVSELLQLGANAKLSSYEKLPQALESLKLKAS